METRVPVMMREDAHESYEELVSYYKHINNTTLIAPFLVEIFTNALHDLKLKQGIATHTNPQMYSGIGNLHSKVIKRINEKWDFNKLEDKSNFKALHSDILNIIREVFDKKDRRTLNSRRDELLHSLQLKVIQEKGKYFVVHKTYIQISPNQTLDRFSEQTNQIISFLISTIKKNKEGKARQWIQQQIGKNTKKPEVAYKHFIKEAEKEGIIYNSFEDRYQLSNKEVSSEDEALKFFNEYNKEVAK